VVGVDLDEKAVSCARRNGVSALRGEAGAVPLASHRFDVVTAVAPYVPTAAIEFLPADVQHYEPLLAIDGGHDGLDLVRRVVGSAARLLRAGGWLFVEVGGQQDQSLTTDLTREGFVDCTTWCDSDGDLRGLAARRGR
jgi:release factor glutamine methyltransferase